MKTRYDVSNLMSSSSRHTDLREAFNLAKEIAKQQGIAVIRKIDWDNDNRIVATKNCFVNPDGSFYY